ncbi:uncharacterized protein LOC115661712 [Syzygium oleosum]|uniref:uncharacterized protein LOC115661712 n=1 Tax=Syzygium oleosum TaxID=219896 RepID=UPI0024B8AB2A|nr:uncharacterized protein LOC115661712 [Syzygium oleosum]
MVRATDDRVSRFSTWDTFTSKEEGISYITNVVLPHPWYRAICLHDRLVGGISVRPVALIRDHRSTSQIGYGLASAYWGRGIMTRAVKMAAAAVFREWSELLRLQALVDVENVGSIRALEAGFRREGVLRHGEGKS